MIIETENTPETKATPELVDALLRDAGRRGAWLVLKDDADDARFVQAEESDEGFSLEWRAGADAPLRRASRPLPPDEARSAFRAFLAGDTDWTSRYDWTDEADASAAGAPVMRKSILTFLAALVAAFLATNLVAQLELWHIGNCGSLAECLNPCFFYAEFREFAAQGDWSGFFSGLFEIGILPVPVAAALVCTIACKKPWKAVLFAALAAALVETVWFFPFAAGCCC